MPDDEFWRFLVAELLLLRAELLLLRAELLLLRPELLLLRLPELLRFPRLPDERELDFVVFSAMSRPHPCP